VNTRNPAVLSGALDSALKLHRAGRLQEAEIAYRRVVEANPENVEALHLLGAFLVQRGRFAAAVDMMERAVRCRPSDPVLRSNLGNALKDAGRPADAEESYRQALKRRPDFADAHSNLGCLLHSLGRFAEAEQSLRKALAFEPMHAFAHNYLGMVLGDLGRLEEAVQSFRRALAIQPHFPHAHHNLGIALMELRQPEEAEQCHRKALALAPHFAVIHNDLGDALAALGRWEEAEQSYRQALALEPALALAHVGIGNVLRQRAQLKEAEDSYREALKFAPNLARAHSNLGLTLFELARPEEAEQCYVQALALEPALYSAHANFAHVLMGLGRLEEAERSYRRALALKPTLAAAHSNLALLLNHMPGRTAAEIYAEHCEFGRRFRQSDPVRPYRNTPLPERRLRIGYVSADLRHHSVAFFIGPILSQYDKRAWEVICYYNCPRSDATTQRLKSHADRWHDVFGLKDDALADLIREDAIDILVDLSGHTGNNRLLTFARKPAPVQVTWLGYLNTTGLEAMDWRITDARATPEGLFDSLHSEKLLRLPDSQWCYEPPDRCPAVVPPPSAHADLCTFGAFSTPAKINAQVIEVWSRLLRSVPRSRLLIVANGLTSIPTDYRERFTRQGIDQKRLDLVPSKAFDDYLALHGSVDVILDTFPYTGGTTTCHALWMGVPVVSLVGDTATSRGGASLLSSVGLPELVAETPDQYLDIAAAHARDPQRLASLRATLRERMRSSALTDAVRFTRHLENAYRTMWRSWCSG